MSIANDGRQTPFKLLFVEVGTYFDSFEYPCACAANIRDKSDSENHTNIRSITLHFFF